MVSEHSKDVLRKAEFVRQFKVRMKAQGPLDVPVGTSKPLPKAGPLEPSTFLPAKPGQREGTQLYQQREAPKPTLLERLSPLAHVPLPGAGITLRQVSEKGLPLVATALTPLTKATEWYDKLAEENDLPTSDALFLANPGLKMMGGLEQAAIQAKLLQAGRAAATGAKATLGRAIETGGVSAGIPVKARTVAARVPPMRRLTWDELKKVPHITDDKGQDMTWGKLMDAQLSQRQFRSQAGGKATEIVRITDSERPTWVLVRPSPKPPRLVAPAASDTRQARATRRVGSGAELPLEAPSSVGRQAEMPVTNPAASKALGPAVRAAQATEGDRIDAAISRFQSSQVAKETEAQFVTRRMTEIRADLKANGLRGIPVSQQQELLRQEYRSAIIPTAPVEAKAVSESVAPGTESVAAKGGLVSPVPASQARASQVPSSPGSAAPPAKPLARTPSEATAQVKAVQQEGLKTPETVLAADAKKAHVEMGAPDGPQPPKPPRPTAKGATPPPDEPADIVAEIAAKATQGERPDQTLLRLHEAAISNEARRNGIIVRDGNAKLKALGIGVTRRGQLIPRTEDIGKLDELYNALHNPSKVASGEMQVPEGYEAIYAELRRLTDWEQAARLDFDPAMATVNDYFYRGWKPPEGAFAGVSQGRPLVKTPAFKKPRVDATYQELRAAGFEPLFWNPYQQWGLSRMQGTKYREQMQLVEHLKGMGEELARPHLGGPIPKGWRVPEIGPAFEGKSFATTDAMGEPVAMYTRRWIVPDNIANALENAYGKRPDIGKFTVGGKTIDPLAVIDFLTFVPKRAKLIGSFFQQVDFATRGGAGSWTRMADALAAGHPIESVKALAMYPKTVATMVRANFSSVYRQSLARQLDSVESLVAGRPGVTLKGVSEAGLSTFDPAMFQWQDMDKVVRAVAQETGVLGGAKGTLRSIGDLESAMRRGLFEGVYPAAMITDIRNNVAPMLARMYPKANDAQLNGMIARIINVKYSSIPASQSVIQNRVLRETLRRVFFSIGESEGLLRQAAGVVSGPNKKFWMKHWLGTYLFVIAAAAAIHYASTGEPLPKERFVPISKDKWGPLPFGYNTRFASPTIPIKGRGGAELTLDVVGQMDTALRILNPGQFITSRESIPIRAMLNQASGTDFFGNRIDDVGPGGVVSRTAQLAEDMFSPIGSGGIASEAARRNIPGAEQVIQEGETRLGMAGLGVQATGLNLRAATREQRLRSTFGPQATTTLKAMDKLGVDLGYVTRNFDMALGKKGGEIILTSEQREQLQWLTDDTVVQGLQTFNFSNTALSKETTKELLQKNIATLRANARAGFRAQLFQQGVTSTPKVPAKTTPTSAAPTTSLEDARQRLRELAGVK